MKRRVPRWTWHAICLVSGFGLIFFFGDMTLVTYRRKSFSMREDDSCAPHSPHTMSIQQVRPFGLGGFGVSSCVIWGEEAFQLFNLFPNLPFALFYPPPF